MLFIADISLFILALLLTIGFCVIGIITSCCCCCYNPISYMLSYFFNMRKRDNYNIPIPSSSPTVVYANYQVIPTGNRESEPFAYHPTMMNEASAPPMPANMTMMQVAEVEAYMVPPLASAHKDMIYEHAYHSYDTNHHHHDAIHVPSSSIKSSSPPPSSSSSMVASFKDVWAAIFFIINVVVLLYFSLKSIYTINNDISSSSSSSYDNVVDWHDIAMMSYFALGFAVCALFLSYLWLIILLSHASSLIDIILRCNIISSFISSMISLLSGNIILCIILLVAVCMNIWYYYSVQHRIPFASSILATASSAVNHHFYGIIITSYMMMMMQMIWFALWSIACYGIINDPYYFSNHHHPSSSHHTSSSHHHSSSSSSYDDNSINNMQIGCIFLLFVSLYWGVQVIKYLVQATVSGTVACWWFQPDRKHVVRGSLFRASSSSFGSICYGALLVAIITSTRELIHIIRRSSSSSSSRRRSSSSSSPQMIMMMVLCCAECVLKIIEDVLVYINRFAFCYVAAYGYGFIESGQKVYDLFKQRGWIAIINDNLIGNCLSLVIMSLSIIMGIIGFIIGSLYSSSIANIINSDATTAVMMMTVMAAVIGAIVSQVFVNVLDSAVAMVFVCYAESPDTLKENHPDAYEVLFRGWNYMEPLEKSGYLAVSPAADDRESEIDLDTYASSSSSSYAQSGLASSYLPEPYVHGQPRMNRGYPTTL